MATILTSLLAKRRPKIVSLELDIESLPVILHGDPDESPGAFVNGQVFINVHGAYAQMHMLIMSLVLVIRQKEPFRDYCSQCRCQKTEVQTWSLINPNVTLPPGKHSFPFSMLLPGHYPPSIQTPIASVTYEFKITTTFSSETAAATSYPDSSYDNAKLVRKLVVSRLLPAQSIPKAFRAFFPSNIKIEAHLPQSFVVSSRNRVNFTLCSPIIQDLSTNDRFFWRLFSACWKLDEIVEVDALACQRHEIIGCIPNIKPHLLRSSSYTAAEGLVLHLTKPTSVEQNFQGRQSKAAFDVMVSDIIASSTHLCPGRRSSDFAGIAITHLLRIQLSVRQEFIPGAAARSQLRLWNPVTRLIELSCPVVMTRSPGKCLSWDVDVPPGYQDVTCQPPCYPGLE